MADEIFRKKSLDKVNSPDDLNDYVRVANPGVWMVLTAIILLLIGICIWGIFGRIETTVPVIINSKGGEVVCSVDDGKSELIQPGMSVVVGDKEGKVISADKDEITVEIILPDGAYEGNIITESIKPISFIFN